MYGSARIVERNFEMTSLSRMAAKCRKCPFVSSCNCKRLEAEGYLVPAASEIKQPMLQDILIKHDYRNVKVGENTTVTIDLEELKRQLKRNIYRQAGVGLYPGA